MRYSGIGFARHTLLAGAVFSSACCLDYWGEVEEQATSTDLRLDDVVVQGSLGHGMIAFGAGGLVLLDGERVELGVDVEFHGIAQGWGGGDAVAIVGDAGTIATYHRGWDQQTGSWELEQAPTSKALVAVGFSAGGMVAVGDDVVVTFDDMGEPQIHEAPDGDWGALNTVVITDEYADGRTFFGGDDGVAWVVDHDASVIGAVWSIENARRLDLGVDEDILAGGYHDDDKHYWLVGEGGLALYEHSRDDWRRVEVGTSANFVDFAAGAALTADGELWDPARQRLIVEVSWARGIGEGNRNYFHDDGDPYEDHEVLIVGDRGRYAILDGC